MFDAAFGDQHANALGGQALQGIDQFVVGLGRHAHPQNAGELSRHARHAAFQPVAAVLGNALGNALDLPRLVRSKNSENEVVHGAALQS
ncbi:hypothetical protein D3C79_842820 [compost metagenome]